MPAVVVAGAVAAAGAVGGAVLSSSAQKKAASKAAAGQQDATAQNNALAREQYGQNQAALAPWQQRGNTAGGALNALLGLGGPAPIVGNGPSNNMGQAQISPYGGSIGQTGGFSNGEPMGYGQSNGYTPNDAMTTNVNTQAAPQNAQQQYENAFDNYKKSTGYQFRVNEGGRALDNSYASRGVGQSGAAAKAALNYGQNIASGEFGNYINQLFGISNQGLSAANAQAGVGSAMVNTITNNNQNAADAASNAALLKGQANGNLYAGIGNALGNLGGTFASSFGGRSGGGGSNIGFRIPGQSGFY